MRISWCAYARAGLLHTPTTLTTTRCSCRQEAEHAEYLLHLDRLARGEETETPSADGAFERTLQDGSTVNVQMGAPLANSTLWCGSEMKWGDQGVSEQLFVPPRYLSSRLRFPHSFCA